MFSHEIQCKIKCYYVKHYSQVEKLDELLRWHLFQQLEMILTSWPFKEIIQAAACTAVVYMSSERIRIYCLKAQAWYRNRMIQSEAVSSKEIKHLMFEEVKSIINSESGGETERTMLEIGIGCGKNFSYHAANTSLIGLESNSFCEAYAWQNSQQFKHIHMKEYLIGFPENMSFIRSNSMQVVLATNPDIHDHEQTLEEVYRILKQVG